MGGAGGGEGQRGGMGIGYEQTSSSHKYGCNKPALYRERYQRNKQTVTAMDWEWIQTNRIAMFESNLFLVVEIFQC